MNLVEDTVEQNNFGIKWSLRCLSQKETSEKLVNPQLLNQSNSTNGYQSLAESLQQFYTIGALPSSIKLDRLVSNNNSVENSLHANNAVYHKTCRLLYNKQEYDRAKKRK